MKRNLTSNHQSKTNYYAESIQEDTPNFKPLLANTANPIADPTTSAKRKKGT